MVEAKDTVLKIKWASKEIQRDQDRVLLKQAEVSFKAGYEQGEKDSLDAEGWCDGFDKGKKAGIKEVVKWINKTFTNTITKNQMTATNTWQTKLKEWGIDNPFEV